MNNTIRTLKETKEFKVIANDARKIFRSKNYNYNMSLTNGNFDRWGKTFDDDPEFSPFGPEILDVEISTKCAGGCPYCYKSNTPNGTNMSLDTFKKIIGQINSNHTLTQVAFGLGATGQENSDLWDMCDWLRSQHIIPNGTIADIDEITADQIASHFGAVAISFHDNFDNPHDLLGNQIAMLAKRGMKQINCHFVLAKETLKDLDKLFDEKLHDPRFAGLNAIVLLGLKQCGRASKGNYQPISQNEFTDIVKRALDAHIGIGFDSCSAASFERAILSMDLSSEAKKYFISLSERCESGCFSQYVNVDGVAFPCSFTEEKESGFDLLGNLDFITDHWMKGSLGWKNKVLANKRECPHYKIRG
jgi:sulfatase maturation enzyme AslB (radical SAM superfamily)